MVTNAGSGYSRADGLDVTRWREDATRDAWGQFLYVRDLATAVVWSAGYQPTCRPADEYEVVFSADKATFRRRDEGIETRTEVTVSPEGLAEVRRVTLTNFGATAARAGADELRRGRARPAPGPTWRTRRSASSSWRPSGSPSPAALLCRRRPRSDDQAPLWALHVSAADAGAGGARVSRPTAPGSSAGAGPRRRPPRSTRARRSPGPSARCSTRSSASAAGSGSSRAARSMVAFTTAVAGDRDEAVRPRRPVPRAGAPSRGRSTSPGPTARSSTATAAGRPRRPCSTSGSPPT